MVLVMNTKAKSMNISIEYRRFELSDIRIEQYNRSTEDIATVLSYAIT